MTKKKKIKHSKVKKMVISVLVLVFFLGGIGTGSYFLWLSKGGNEQSVKAIVDSGFGWKFPVTKFPETGPDGQLAYSTIRDPGGVPQGLPVRLKIPIIGVNAAIEDALITPDGRMDVPAGTVNVAWFALGPHPGNEGSAVIGGHYGIDNGVPKVFFNLNKLKAGDKVQVVNDKGETLVFIVRRTQSFDRNADATSVFTSGGGAHLNIITCEGIWNQVNDSYPQRLVIFTDLVPGETAEAVSTPAPVVVKTKVEVIAKAKATTAPTVMPTSTPSPPPADAVASESPKASPINTPTSSDNLTPYLKSLYSSPISGAVSSILIISVVIVIFKIIHR